MSNTDRSQSKIPQNEARSRLENYTTSGAFAGPSAANQIREDLLLQAVALKENGAPVDIMHTDACKRFLFHLASRSPPPIRLTVSPRLPPPTPPTPNPLF